MFTAANRKVLEHVTVVHNCHLLIRVTEIPILILEKMRMSHGCLKVF